MQGLCLLCAIPLAPVGDDVYFSIILSENDPLSVPASEHARKLSASNYKWPQQGLIASLGKKSRDYQKNKKKKGERVLQLKLTGFIKILLQSDGNFGSGKKGKVEKRK